MITLNKQKSPKSLVIWLHGLGADCNDFTHFIEKLDRSECEFILPNAPSIPITLNKGMMMRGWYDIHALNFEFQDNIGLEASKIMIEKIINKRVSQLSNFPKIIIAGFSQGAALSIYIGLTSKINIDGVISLSGYQPKISNDSFIKNNPRMLAMHGRHDDIININIAKLSYQKNSLENFTLKVLDIGHEVIDKQILDIQQFLLGIHDYE